MNCIFNMSLISLILLFRNPPKPWEVFSVHKIYTQLYLKGFIFSNLLWEKVELTLTNDPHCSHHLSDSKISERRCPKDRRQSKEMVEGRDNLQEMVQERSSCCGWGSQRNTHGDQGQAKQVRERPWVPSTLGIHWTKGRVFSVREGGRSLSSPLTRLLMLLFLHCEKMDVWSDTWEQLKTVFIIVCPDPFMIKAK